MPRCSHRLLAPRLIALLCFPCVGAAPGCAHQRTSSPEAAATLVERGPTSWEPFTAWQLSRDQGPAIDVYVARREGRRPTVLLLPGSKCLPLFWVLPGRKISPLFLQGAIPKAVEHVNFAAFDRRGLKSFGPPPTSEEEARRLARCSRTRGGVSKDERVENARDVASQLLAQPWVSELWLLGHSEGADVAAGVARQLPGKVSAVALFAGAGITRFFEQTTAARKMEGSAGAAQVLQGMIAMTGAGPAADHDDDMVQALTYGVNSTPLDDLRGLDVPVFVAHGDNDEKVPIEAADAFVAELLRERRRALRYVIVPGVDHGFYDNNGVDHAEAVLHEFLTWAGASDKPRTVEVWSRER